MNPIIVKYIMYNNIIGAYISNKTTYKEIAEEFFNKFPDFNDGHVVYLYNNNRIDSSSLIKDDYIYIEISNDYISINNISGKYEARHNNYVKIIFPMDYFIMLREILYNMENLSEIEISYQHLILNYLESELDILYTEDYNERLKIIEIEYNKNKNS